jgi:hypothetical protein
MSIKMKKLLIALAIIVAGSFVIAISLFYSTGGLRPLSSITKDISQIEEIDASGIKAINISSVSAPVKVIIGEGNKIKADFKGKIKTNISGRTPELSILKINGELTIEIIYPAIVGFGIFDISDLSLEVAIPEEIAALTKISTTSAKIDIENIKVAELFAESVSGAINLNNIKANNIEIENTSGKCLIDDSNGRINIDTVSGEAVINLKQLDDEIKVSSISGDVRLNIPEDSSFDFDLSSISGKIENNLISKISYADRQEIKGTVGNGDFNININTISGRIVLECN